VLQIIPCRLTRRRNLLILLSRLDGLNKNMDDWDVGYYGRLFNAKCREIGMTAINFPQGTKDVGSHSYMSHR
jgi:hypothetical protein